MEGSFELRLSAGTMESLELYSKLLDKDYTTMIEEALRGYFEACDEIVGTAGSAESNLDYDEFWDGVEL